MGKIGTEIFQYWIFPLNFIALFLYRCRLFKGSDPQDQFQLFFDRVYGVFLLQKRIKIETGSFLNKKRTIA